MPQTHPIDRDVPADAATAPQPKPRPYGLARWTILGRMTADPEPRYTASGKAVLNFRLATTVAGATTFHRVTVIWNEADRVGHARVWTAPATRPLLG